MKNLMIRAFVVALAVAGVSASAYTNHSARHQVKGATTVAVVPLCSPNDIHGCGLDQN